MDMTRATFLIAAALVVALAVAAAGIGAYIAVRQNAPASNVTLEQAAPETRVAAALHGIDPRAAVGEARSEPGIAVASTEQVLEPAAEPAPNRRTWRFRRPRGQPLRRLDRNRSRDVPRGRQLPPRGRPILRAGSRQGRRHG